MRTHVDLCTGIGGFSLGFIAAKLSEPVLLCDFDEKVRKLLKNSLKVKIVVQKKQRSFFFN